MRRRRIWRRGRRWTRSARRLGVSEATYHRWKKQYGGAGAEEVRRLKELEKENARLKAIVADLELDKRILKEALEGNY